MANNFRKKLLENRDKDIRTLMVEQRFNKLFYEKPDIRGELRFMKLLLNREGEAQERYGLHLSAIMASRKKFCLREQVLSLFFKQEQDENINVGLKRIFVEGESIHEKWQRLFIRGGLGLPENMDRPRFVEKYDLFYTPDAAIDILRMEDVPVEIKSMNTSTFKKQVGHPSGESQLNMYQFFERKPTGIVLMEDKNTQDFKVKITTFNKEKAKPYITRLKETREAKQTFIQAKKLPARICEGCNSKRALECNMRSACYGVGIGRIKL